MESIVTALDKPWPERIEEIWGEMKAVLGLKGLSGETRPHFTYQSAESYDAARIGNALAGIAAGSLKLEAETAGVELFHGEQAIVYLSIVPTDQLRALHQRVWEATHRIAEERNNAYAAATWVPHINVAGGTLNDDEVEPLREFLSRKEYRWKFPVSNLCHVPDLDDQDGAWLRFDFG